MHKPDELRELAESYLADLALTPELHGQAESVRYALTMGGKRVRPVICLATAEAAGADAERALPAAASVELVHNFSLVHDDLPALDNDDVRRGNPSVWARHGAPTPGPTAPTPSVVARDAADRLPLRPRAGHDHVPDHAHRPHDAPPA